MIMPDAPVLSPARSTKGAVDCQNARAFSCSSLDAPLATKAVMGFSSVHISSSGFSGPDSSTSKVSHAESSAGKTSRRLPEETRL